MSTPGSGWWLLRHELRLAWRTIGGKSLWFVGITGSLLWVAEHALLWLVMGQSESIQTGHFKSGSVQLAGGLFWLLASVMLSQTMAHAVAALFDRGDLDLLLSSPLSARAIFFVRGVGIALSACMLPAFLLLPIAHVGPFLGFPGLLAIYPVVLALAFACASVGMMVTMSLVRWLGARRARVAAQVLAALIGAGFFIVSQLPNYLSQQKNNVIVAWFKRELDGDGWLSPGSVLWWPARAMTGEWLPLVIVMIVSFGGFWAVVNLTYRRFVTGTQESVTAGRTAHRTSLEPIRFQGGFARMLLLKEWRTIWRDPQIISQTLLQLLYLFPMLFLGFSGRQSSWVLIPGLVMMGSMLAGNLAWLTIAAEDAPELVGTAPVSIDRVRFLKAVAAVAPVMALLLPLALWWSFRDPYLACVLLLCTVGGASSAALCQIWNPRQGNRRDLKLRYRQNRLVNVLESLGAMGWAGVAFCLNGHVLWLPVPLFFVTLGPGSAWLLGHRARRSGALA